MRLAIAAFVAALSIAPLVDAKTLRWASQGDILTMDPHAQNEGLNNTANSYIYESLVTYNEKFEVVPALSTDWKQETPLIWRFNLRQGVKFHDGSPLTADRCRVLYRSRDAADVELPVSTPWRSTRAGG